MWGYTMCGVWCAGATHTVSCAMCGEWCTALICVLKCVCSVCTVYCAVYEVYCIVRGDEGGCVVYRGGAVWRVVCGAWRVMHRGCCRVMHGAHECGVCQAHLPPWHAGGWPRARGACRPIGAGCRLRPPSACMRTPYRRCHHVHTACM